MGLLTQIRKNIHLVAINLVTRPAIKSYIHSVLQGTLDAVVSGCAECIAIYFEVFVILNQPSFLVLLFLAFLLKSTDHWTIQSTLNCVNDVYKICQTNCNAMPYDPTSPLSTASTMLIMLNQHTPQI